MARCAGKMGHGFRLYFPIGMKWVEEIGRRRGLDKIWVSSAKEMVEDQIQGVLPSLKFSPSVTPFDISAGSVISLRNSITR